MVLAVVVLDVDPGRAGEGAPAVDLGDLVLLHQEVDALDDAGAHVAAALVGRAEGHRGVALDAELRLLVLERVRQLGVLEQGLGRDAADVEADTSPVLRLHHGDLLAELGGADRGDVATGAGAEDEGVEVRVGHGPQPSCPPRGGTPEVVARYPVARDAVRRLRDEPRSRPHERALPPLDPPLHRLADGLAADVRRRGARLGRRPRRRSSRTRSSRSSSRSTTSRPRTSGRSTAGRPPTPASTARPRCGCRR